MTLDFTSLKKNRKQNFEEMTAKIDAMQKSARVIDEREWQPITDKAGNGFAIIRYLPAHKDEEIPFVLVYSHGYQGPTGDWYIENCPTTIGKKCPQCDDNSVLWKTEVKSNQNIVRGRSRKARFLSNIQIIKEPARPDNEGKIFLFGYGKKIYGRIEAMRKPAEGAGDPIDVFDLWEGCNFKLTIRAGDKVNGKVMRNYDSSSFSDSAALNSDDAILEEIYNNLYPLKPFIAPDKFKSYDELKTRMNLVLGKNVQTNVEIETEVKNPIFEPSQNPAESNHLTTNEDDDVLAQFQGLVDEN